MEEEQANELDGKTLKEGGSRIVGPTRRPDGTLRKPIRIRPGYTPPDEIQIYQSKGAIWKKEIAALQEAPPGYEPEVVAKPKTKAAKRNERKKEKRHQASLEKGELIGDDCASSADGFEGAPDHVESVASQMRVLSISATSSTNNRPLNSMENGISEDQGQDIDKKIRALKKKIRLTEAQQQKTTKKDMEPEQLEKLAKLESWHHELKLLEEKRAEIVQTPRM